MRLLNVHDFTSKSFDKHPEPYAILSHRWSDSETTFADVQAGRVSSRTASNKVVAFAQYVETHIPGLDWIWVDSCCINQESTAELSEGVNCMFDWYQSACLCIAYLHDVEDANDLDAFRASVWFTRAWTLQELLASTVVVFVTRHWRVIGHKGNAVHLSGKIEVGDNIDKSLADITRIPVEVLQDYKASLLLSYEKRRSWMNGRDALKEEDQVYALFGIFDVRPGANYGENLANAEHRLLEAIERKQRFSSECDRSPLDEELALRIETWLSPPDPSTNHATARDRHESGTCQWLLQREEYIRWKTGEIKHLWLSGKPGCGKSVLCSTVIQDLQSYCLDKPGSTLAYFYFTFSDDRKQSYDDLILSLTNQFRRREPARSRLRMLHKSGRSRPDKHELQSLLVSAAAAYEEVFFVLDALDESPEFSHKRRDLLKAVEKLLLQRLTKFKLFATSRPLPDIRGSMDTLGCETISIQPSDVSGDIQHYVLKQLSTDPRLREFAPTVKTVIEQNVSDNADGMFRWTFLLLDKLAKVKKSNKSTIKAALESFPKDLDKVYNRILEEVDEECQYDVLKLLRWIAYAQRPLRLQELVDALVVRPENGTADLEDRCEPGDILRLLTSLIITVAPHSTDRKYAQLIRSTTEIRLAHFTVQEYLESARILESSAGRFHLESEPGHAFITQSCLTYLLCYSSSDCKESNENDLKTFPLLRYAAEDWYKHARLQKDASIDLQLKLLETETALKDWLTVRKPDQPWQSLFDQKDYDFTAGGLYYASTMGLKPVVRSLLDKGADVNAKGGYVYDALNAASWLGHTEVVRLLLDAGADAKAFGGVYSTALHAASMRGWLDIVKLLLDHGADIHVFDRGRRTALMIAATRSHLEAMKLLLDRGADVNAQQGNGETVLQTALIRADYEVVKLLLDRGADINAQGSYDGNALYAACAKRGDRLEVVQLLLDRGADVSMEGGRHGSALGAALAEGNTEIVKLLTSHGAELPERNSAAHTTSRSPTHDASHTD